jgi:DNA-directed RNA polymerase subunit beta
MLKKYDLIQRHSFGKIPQVVDYPDLLEVQTNSFDSFLQADVPSNKRIEDGLQSVFLSVFPIEDARGNYLLEFVEYGLDKPRYSVLECQERGVSYAAPLKAKLRLSIKDPSGETEEYTESVEQDVYLGNMPVMTNRGTFIINGAERVIVSQLHRSPGVFFDKTYHPNGTELFSARIIPFRGSWVEFMTDVNDNLFVYIDRKKKFPATALLRALGYSSDEEVLNLFNLVEEVSLNARDVKRRFGAVIAEDYINKETGEILVEKNDAFNEDTYKRLKSNKKVEVSLFREDKEHSPGIINNTLAKDPSRNQEEALQYIYRLLRASDAPDIETAKQLIDRLFFNPKRYDLGRVGRYRINKKLKLEIDLDTVVLTIDDLIAIIKMLLELRTGKRNPDDIDHLGNRRVRTVGEQLGTQFSTGLSRMARTIRERMNVGDGENVTPQDLVNARTISSVINTFFGTSQLSQFMDQTNPLSETTHKRRLSALGPGGLTRERAGFEVRDIHYTHYGRMCPIETPEGPNIGLISSMCVHARINDFGFLETPYRKVRDSRVTNEIEFLTANDEDRYVIAQVNAPLDEEGRFVRDQVLVRNRGEYVLESPDRVDYMDVASNQMLSAAAGLIPFLEHDDANRALMGSNMQRQGVPLLRPETPIVGTGMEEIIARDSKTLIRAEFDCVIKAVDANSITVEPIGDYYEDESRLRPPLKSKTYKLTKFLRTNQDTIQNQRPIVYTGQKVKKGQPLADGASTEKGQLAIGKNVLVAFMPWHGYNYEDAIIISRRVVEEDVYTSIHIEEYELQVRDTKRGAEELTREIPNISEEATRNLDENGIIRVGAEVFEGDIIVGKVTPKGETDPTPEEKLLKAIFGSKAGDVKDASLKAPPGMKGIVIDTKLFSRKKKDQKTAKMDKAAVEMLEKRAARDQRDLLEAMHNRLVEMVGNRKFDKDFRLRDSQVFVNAGDTLKKANVKKLDPEMILIEEGWFSDKELSKSVESLVLDYYSRTKEIDADLKREKHKIMVGDELPSGIVQLAKVYIAKKRKLSVGDKMAGRHGNKGVVSRIVPPEDMPFLPDGRPVDIILNPLGVPSRMNLGQIFETTLGWAGKILGKHYATPVFDGASLDDVKIELDQANLPLEGRTLLYDGRTGEKFHQEITVGYIYMLKLSHLVDDKIHARSIGPYSLITQQPLGGKAQFGGQRFGEMEVWALEAYGAAHTLQEMLTYKSDDVQGRSEVYASIVKGQNLPAPGIPESFNVLLRELMGLGLDIRIDQ